MVVLMLRPCCTPHAFFLSSAPSPLSPRTAQVKLLTEKKSESQNFYTGFTDREIAVTKGLEPAGCATLHAV